VFGISALLMLVAVVLMFAQDYFQPWKTEQRVFRDVDQGISAQAMIKEAAVALKDWQDAEHRAYEAREIYDAVKAEDPLYKAQIAFDNADKKRGGIKADYDSYVSLRNIARDNQDRAVIANNKAQAEEFGNEVKKIEDKLAKLKKELDDADNQVEKYNLAINDARNNNLKVKVKVGKEKKEVEISLNEAKKQLDDAEARQKEKTGKVDNLAKAVAKKKWGFGDFVRRLPIIDGFNPSLKINQITLEGYPIDYSFKRVTRYDRCTTCHLGIDQEKFDHASLASLKEGGNKEDREALKELRKFYETRADHGEELGFSPSDLPSDHVQVKLTEGQVRQFAAHPRLDMFLDPKSPHPIEKFGCTACHAGQGSSTTFNNASHVPNNAEEKHRWEKEHDWEMTHAGDWEYPMLAHRFVESSCLKCHHQVTDTISYGSREEAPKLLKGYNLIKDFGCYGCHEIAGYKQGVEIGPDLRLELSPPIETLPPAEREKLLADKTNPPGNLRKVGPSLYRLSEKVDGDWVARWVRDPRGFRPDTKMPHFYGLSNNDKSVLPPEQQAFPDMEIRSIAFYLMQESNAYLSNKDGHYQDIYHRLLDTRRKELEARKKELEADGLKLTVKEEQELQDVTERLDPKLQKEKSPSLQLEQSPHKVADQIVDSRGNVVDNKDIPATDRAKLGEGARLFRERGCLACHSHDATATETSDDKGTIPPVISEANFGPNLSRLKAKFAASGDDAEKRRWLIQWILNPNIHNPRTRMPITHVSVEQATRIADWLLNQDEGDLDGWAKVDPTSDIKISELSELVRVYLAKAPDMTRGKVEKALTPNGDGITGFPQTKPNDPNALKWMADERELLQGGDGAAVGKDKMLWYVGRKAISRYGCYACHDIPGFETSKPIGTPLNDWGRKDPERLAFEDGVAYVREHHSIVDRLRDDNGKIVAKQGSSNDPIFERFFLEALEHHQRDGFLHQKLNEPRSFDFHRTLAWDDRLRMPQFRFARGAARHKEEDPMRAQVEEIEAREAVMTFVLGLVAEPVPSAYMPHPDADRQAEIKGRQVLDKFNCAGCHMIRAGVYDFRLDGPDGADVLQKLRETLDRARPEIDKGYPEFFKDHNAWVAAAQQRSDRVRAFGIELTRDDSDQTMSLVPTQALRFEDTEGDSPGTRNVPSGVKLLGIPGNTLVQRRSAQGPRDPAPYGGDFGDLLMGKYKYRFPIEGDIVNYMKTQPNVPAGAGEDVQRSLLPPPLHREGEKVQPVWLQRFLRDPKPIRPPERMLLRMPKFNMSDEEIDAIVHYFVAVDRLENPGASTANPWLPPEQLGADFWQKRNEDYVKTLKKNNKLDTRQDDKDLQASLRAFIEARVLPDLPQQLDDKKAQVETQEAAVKSANGKEKEEAQKKLDELKKEQKDLEDRVKELNTNPDKARQEETKRALPEYVDRWKKNEEYATDGFHLLVARSTTDTTCLKCHNIGQHFAPLPRQGPTLFFRKDQTLFQHNAASPGAMDTEAYIASERLRPEWVLRWVAQPARLHGYSTPMVQVFDKEPTATQSALFEGDQADRITALRNVLMNTPPVADLPGNRFYRNGIGEKKP
jgi:mono/diheme cytochrome c family protein